MKKNENKPNTPAAAATPPAGESAITAAANTLAMIERLATNPDANIVALEKLVMLQERVLDREARARLQSAMAEVKGELIANPAKKTAAVKKDGNVIYTYAPMIEVQRVVDPIFAARGISYHFDEEIIPGETPADAIIKCTTTIKGFGVDFKSVRSAYYYDGMAGGKSLMSKPQASGAQSSFMQRYGLYAAVGIPLEEGGDDIIEKGEAADNKPAPTDALDWQPINTARKEVIAEHQHNDKFPITKLSKGSSAESRAWLAQARTIAGKGKPMDMGAFAALDAGTLRQVFYNAACEKGWL